MFISLSRAPDYSLILLPSLETQAKIYWSECHVHRCLLYRQSTDWKCKVPRIFLLYRLQINFPRNFCLKVFYSTNVIFLASGMLRDTPQRRRYDCEIFDEKIRHRVEFCSQWRSRITLTVKKSYTIDFWERRENLILLSKINPRVCESCRIHDKIIKAGILVASLVLNLG